MKRLYFSLAFFFWVSVFYGSPTVAQTTNNPFSRLGIGDLTPRTSLANLGMGGAGVSLPTVRGINLQNPALLRFHRLVVFEGAMNGEYKDISNTSLQTNDFGANLAYLSLALPVKTNWVFNIGFQPYSTVKYSAVSEELLPQTPTFVRYEYAGRGGISQVYLGTGVKVIQNLSIGAQINYNFGAITNTARSILDDRRAGFVAALTDRYNYNDFTYRLGAHYFVPVFEKSQINLGVSYDAKIKLTPTHFRAFERQTFSELAIDGDTIIANTKQNVQLPQRLSVGFSVQRGYLQAASGSNNTAYSFGIDYSMQDWTIANEDAVVQNRLQNSYTINIGGEITPNVRSTKFLQRTVYRLGFSYSQTPLVINNESITDMNLSLGFSLPVRNSFSALSMYGAIGERGTQRTLRERYVRFGMGISISDRWFVRSRFD